jgi:hypothetical protein
MHEPLVYVDDSYSMVRFEYNSYFLQESALIRPTLVNREN